MMTKEEMPICPVATTVESDGIITRAVYPEVPPRAEYALSEIGKTLKPILDSMAEWGQFYRSNLFSS